jgi:hypothetical protein
MVEGGSPAFTAATGPDPDGVCRTLDDITETDVLIGDEPRKAHSIGLAFTRSR